MNATAKNLKPSPQMYNDSLPSALADGIRTRNKKQDFSPTQFG
jgi:hypothetical protein